MSLFSHNDTARKRTLLTPEEMNADKANNAHQRSEEYKKVKNNIKILLVVGGFVAIPLLYIAWCILLYMTNRDELADALKLGAVSSAAFILGRVNLFGGTKETDDEG